MRTRWAICLGIAVSLGACLPAFANSMPYTNFTTGYTHISVPTSGPHGFNFPDPLHSNHFPEGLTLLKSGSPLTRVSAYTYAGKAVTLTGQRPEIFFAWWCPHCHEALKQIKTDGVLDRFNFISVWPDEFGKYRITSLAQVKHDTEKTLKSLGVRIPTSQLFLTLPQNTVNQEIYETPTFLRKVPKGYLYSQGDPKSAVMWKRYLEAKA